MCLAVSTMHTGGARSFCGPELHLRPEIPGYARFWDHSVNGAGGLLTLVLKSVIEGGETHHGVFLGRVSQLPFVHTAGEVRLWNVHTYGLQAVGMRRADLMIM